jgi:hypothetical protein
MDDEDELFREDELRSNALGKALSMAAILGPTKDQTRPSADAIVEFAQTFYTFLKGETK